MGLERRAGYDRGGKSGLGVKKTQAVIFDLDGVLVNSVPLHGRCWELLAKSRGLLYDRELLHQGNGRTTLSYLTEVLCWTKDPEEAMRFAQEKERLYLALVEEQGIETIEGALPFLEQLKARKMPCAVGTSAPRIYAEHILSKVGLLSCFSLLVTADDVREGKPHPEVFLKAAEGLGVASQHCVVFEDAKAGIEAARAAGMYVIALSTTHTKEELSFADQVHASFLTVAL